jgi:hypothetical protein
MHSAGQSPLVDYCLVSAPIRIAGTPLCARRIDLGLHFFGRGRRLIQGIEFFESLSESLGGSIARPV